MDALSILITIGLIHCLLFFFDTIFKTCSHYPYIYFLKNTGIEVQILRIKWFTTAFNRRIRKWGMTRSKFWNAWFNAGVIVTIILLPLATLGILKRTFDIWMNGPSLDNNNSESFLEPMLPGVNMPLNEFGYYVVTLIFCFITHELGHALAAAREGVQLYGVGIVIAFIIPIAYVRISSEQFSSLPLTNQLRVNCAGIWHNVVLATVAATIFMFSTWLWAPLYLYGNGVYVKTVLPNSPLLSPTGLFEEDIIYKINDCYVKHNEDWGDCILNTINQPALGYCVKQSFIQEYDESIPSRQKTDGVINCCTRDSESRGSLCFEYIEGPQAAPLHLPPHSCLPVRVMINQSQNYCHASNECIFHDTHCLKPSLDNVTKIVQIQRREGKDVLFFGYPADIYQTVDVSDWLPKYSFLNPKLPEAVVILCKYVTIFSAGLAILNVIPCFSLDGQYIIDTVVLYFLNLTRQNKHIRQTIVLTVTSIGTLLLVINFLYSLVNKLR
ncbi:PREDICTED: membrane-bound transcription factor site-2 protease [Dufourea novaeangliae]|uniref:membrane-bound transcription factor site-2 protease n=1 Tax=Dufourea novaeangliae TaxID=178035 RepID=UPI0007671D02|nr:PREDICTED: membrane-bound transcription factor site-2 protease [Dufourea novaeangliae]